VRTRQVAGQTLALWLACSATGFSVLGTDWPQFGGPNRDFKTDAKGLADSWPTGGPRRVWSRELGEGYSGIAVEGSRVFTMYRLARGLSPAGNATQEVVVAMDAATGKTLWEYRYDAPFLPSMKMEHGPGPHATPLVAGNLVYAAGVTGKFHALDKVTGKLVWSHDLHEEYGVLWGRGYSCSPLAYKNTVILTLGAKGKAVAAFNQRDGRVVWIKQDFGYGYASPILINVDRQDQLVVFMANEIAGLDPNNGDLLWSHPHRTDWGLNVSTPVWGEDGLLFCSSAYSGGSRVLQLTQKAGKTTVKQLWFTNQMRIHHGNAVRLGDYVYGSSGDFGPAPLTAIDVKNGAIAWRDRTFTKATMVSAAGKLIIVDEDGTLALAVPAAQGLQVKSQVQLLTSNAWTPPTLVGTRLYVRDRKTVHALELN